jgi:glycosyltransferase A (GT-A) superfamily protein (DUF2064 family)
MHVMENEDTGECLRVRDRALRRAIETVGLSDEMAGARVTAAVQKRLANGSQRVVITRADRELPPELVEHAFDALRYSALVCAPGTNGEIALLGMTQPHESLIAAIPWGTNAALNGLLRAARDRHVSLVLLPPPAAGRSD